METDRIRPRNSCINRMGGFGTIHGSGFLDVDSEILGQKSDGCASRFGEDWLPGGLAVEFYYTRQQCYS